MSLYAIGDLHLSLSSNKPMDVFGGKWENYVEKIKEGFSVLQSDDVTVLCGDVSWAMDLQESLTDFKFIDALPGRKIILKGNHDYWWNTMRKIQNFFDENSIHTVAILHNNCHFYDGVALCGTRGWFYEEERHRDHDKKIMNRELMRLEMSLKAAGDSEKICFLHYPPRFRDYVCGEVIEIMNRHGVKRCYYGHIHDAGHKFAIQGDVGGITYKMVSGDYLNFHPEKIL